MAAITFTRTPPRNYLSLGAWQEFKERLATIESILSENSGDYTTGNTVAEFKAAVDAVIAAISGVL